MVDGLPLVVVVGLVVDVAVDSRLQHVREEEHGNSRPEETGPVARQTNVDLPVALHRREGVPPALVRRLTHPNLALLAQALDVGVHVAAHLELNLATLDHLHHLLLLLSGRGVGGPNLFQVLAVVIVHRHLGWEFYYYYPTIQTHT